MFGWHVPAPNQAMLISGGRQKGNNPLPVKIVTGHGAFVMPIRSRVSFLTLAMQESLVTEECVTKQGIALLVRAVIAFKVGDDQESISNAARRFLADQDHMSTLTGQIFSGHLRSIVGSMTVEDIIRERQALAEQVLDGSKQEMAKIGLAVDSLQIQSIDDKGSGYIAALAAPHQATVNQAAQIAQAQADQAAAEARQLSLTKQAEYERETAVARAQYQSEIDQAQARAGQAGPLAAAQAQQDVLVEQAKVAAKNAELRQAQLVAEVVKPAQAEAERIRTLAQAEADRTRMSAQAAAAEGRIALDQLIISQLPQMITAAADGLSNANLTVLNGAEGLNGTVAALASQGLAILRAVTDGLGSGPALDDFEDDRAEGGSNGSTPTGTPQLGQGDGGQPG
jgi:flotillin